MTASQMSMAICWVMISALVFVIMALCLVGFVDNIRDKQRYRDLDRKRRALAAIDRLPREDREFLMKQWRLATEPRRVEKE